ncbi:hypothetical protein cypCar_00020836 [Cyprinus carpio]|nr:hypothetical protein cypCar_00020836 [Cyprinus carpio]
MGNSQRKIPGCGLKKRRRTKRASKNTGQRAGTTAVSNLDTESKLTSHYQAPWHQQHNLFHTCTQPPCLEELHRHAKLNLRALHKAPPMPTFPSTHKLKRRDQRGRHSRLERPAKEAEFKPVLRKKNGNLAIHAGTNTETDGELPVMSHRPKCPVPNVPTTLDKKINWSKALPLPTPEERIKNDSQVVSSCIIPINVSGVGFDREASARCSLVHSQSVLQRRRKLRRRKTITGIPKRVQQDMDSDESPVARERTVIIHANPHKSLWHEELSLSGRVLHTKDSGCQTDDFLIAAPSRRRIRAQRGQGIPASLSHSTGNITSLPDRSDTVYAAASATRVRSRSLPREGGRLLDEDQDDSDDDDEDEDDGEEDEELSPYEAEDFLPGPGQRMMKDEEESTDDQAMPELQFGSLKRMQHSESPDHTWIERGRSRLPRKVDMGSCEISSSSDTFSSPIHSASTTGVLGIQMDHKEDHQSSSGNWSGSSSTCPSQTSETLPPAASPPLTGSSHCDSELSLNTGSHVIDDTTGFIIDPYHIDKPQEQGQRSNSFTSSATDQMDDAGVSTASDGEWNCTQDHQDQPCPQDFSPKHSREDESGVSCPSYSSGETYESFSDQASARKSEMHYIVDTEGFYSSMHFDCGLKGSRSYYNYAAIDPDCGPSGNIAPGMGEYTQSEYRATRTLGRPCLSLKKPKAKPPPPKRSSSLKETSSGVNILEQDEPKITCELPLPLSSREMKLQLDLADSTGHLDTAGLESLGAWGVENVRDMLDCSSPFSSSDTHSFKDEGAVQADYADLWLHNDLKSNDPYRSLSNSSTAMGTTVIECVKSPECAEIQACQPRSRPTSPTLPPPEGDFKLASPEKLVSLASPSSGYSSQSETPTSSFPSAFFPGPLSPTSGKRKPKVPERKSSLCSLQQPQLSVQNPRISSRRETDFHAIPPSHLDLSVLHSKHFSHRNQLHILHQNKQKAAIAALQLAEVAMQSRRRLLAEAALRFYFRVPPVENVALPQEEVKVRQERLGPESTPSDNSSSPLTDDSKTDDDNVFPSPNKLRTTEDLFAMIHRSKRKVLGRKDSGEISGKSRPGVAPATAPASNPTVCPVTPAASVPSNSSQRASGPIYRSAKKSSTSSEEFKLLLLKKGSRSDSSYRMSATEILKSPITPKTQVELLLEAARQAEEPPLPLQESTSSGDPLPSQFPKANSEGFSPKTLTMSAASRQGRSRIPPAANSSRYSTRSRLYTAPMQAISEGETENSDGSPHDDRSS